MTDSPRAIVAGRLGVEERDHRCASPRVDQQRVLCMGGRGTWRTVSKILRRRVPHPQLGPHVGEVPERRRVLVEVVEQARPQQLLRAQALLALLEVAEAHATAHVELQQAT